MIPGSANPLLLKSAAAAGAYQVERSLRFNSSDSAFCARTPGTASTSKTWTLSFWVKLTGQDGGSGQNQIFGAASGSGDTTYYRLWIEESNGGTLNSGTGSAITQLTTTNLLRDYSAWYHILVAFDTTQSTAGLRHRVYINGIEGTYATNIAPSFNTAYSVNSTATHWLGFSNISGRFFNGYLADCYMIDGQALTPSSFTEVSATTGQLIPKAYSGSFGTNGFWLKFSDNSAATAATLGKDYSGNSNNWTPNNLSVTAGAGNDSLVDTPTSFGTDTGVGNEVRGNYATFNALALNGNTLSNGNLDYLAGSANKPTLATIGIPNTGKWYFEFTDVDSTGSFTAGVGTASVGVSTYLGADANGWGYQTHPSNAGYHNSGVFTTTGRINGAGSNTILGVAIDRDAQKIWFSVNGTYVNSGVPASGTNAQYSNLPSSGELFPGASTGSSQNIVFNAGQRAFAYTAPSGFKALCDTNLPAPVVAKPNTLMDVVLYTGNGSTQTISGLGFSPDFVWIKDRTSAFYHRVFDTVRGTSVLLYTNLTDADVAQPNGSDTFSSFNSNGFSLGVGIGLNQSSDAYVAWCWDAGTSTVSNGSGSITSQVRANVSAGFSVATFNSGSSGNKSFGHGLNVAPSLVLIKNRTSSGSWITFHRSAITSVNNFLRLETTDSIQSGTDVWGTSLPDSSLVYFSSTNTVATNVDCVCYSFAPVVGYSAMGSYVGNGSSDGVFVYTGFRPRWILLKESSAAGNNWFIYDTARNTFNVCQSALRANLSDAELTTSNINFDILSNGFKPRNSDSFCNGSGSTYIYAAFAESPFQFSRAR